MIPPRHLARTCSAARARAFAATLQFWWLGGLACASLVAFPGSLHAAGFALFEQGATAMGRSGAFVAGASDPSALFYNPAALADLRDSHLLLSPSVVLFSNSFEGALPYPGPESRASTGVRAFPLPSGYWSHSLGSRAAMALGLTTPFGLESNWTGAPDFTGRFVSERARIERLELTAGAGIRVGTTTRFGASLSLARSRMLLQRALAAPYDGLDRTLEVGRLRFENTRWGDVSWSLAWLARAERVSLGVTVRSAASSRFSGPAQFLYSPFSTGNATQDSLVRSLLPTDQDASLEVRLPWMALWGMEIRAGQRWRLELDMNWTGWDRFERLSVRFAKDPALNLEAPQDFRSTLSVRAGVEYRGEAWSARAGAYRDPSPQPATSVSPILSDAGRTGISLGAGRAWGPWRLDAYALQVLFASRSTESSNLDRFDGTYHPHATLLGVSLGRGL